MNELFDLVSEFKKNNIKSDIKNTDLLLIQKPMQQGDKGYFDFRVIIYYLYGQFLDDYSQLKNILIIISTLLKDDYEVLGPNVYKDKQIGQAIIWLHKRLLVHLDEHNFSVYFKKNSILQNIINDYKDNIKIKCNINYCEYFKALENNLNLLSQENIKQENHILDKNQELDSEKQDLIIEDVKASGQFKSHQLDKLLNKIDFFKKLLFKNKYQDAINVGYIIDQEINNYKIDYYFPDLFVDYFECKLKYFDELEEAKNSSEKTESSKKISLLEKILNSNFDYLNKLS